MSRRARRPVTVTCDPDGAPIALFLPGDREALPVLGLVAYWREWIGVLEGEPERDVWRVETPRGVCELHCLRRPPSEGEEEGAPGEWILDRWED